MQKERRNNKESLSSKTEIGASTAEARHQPDCRDSGWQLFVKSAQLLPLWDEIENLLIEQLSDGKQNEQ